MAKMLNYSLPVKIKKTRTVLSPLPFNPPCRSITESLTDKRRHPRTTTTTVISQMIRLLTSLGTDATQTLLPRTPNQTTTRIRCQMLLRYQIRYAPSIDYYSLKHQRMHAPQGVLASRWNHTSFLNCAHLAILNLFSSRRDKLQRQAIISRKTSTDLDVRSLLMGSRALT